MARKLTKPKIRTKIVAILKIKIAKQRIAQPIQEEEPQNKTLILKPIKSIKPIPPLPN